MSWEDIRGPFPWILPWLSRGPRSTKTLYIAFFPRIFCSGRCLVKDQNVSFSFLRKKNWSEKYFSNFIVHNTVVENSEKDIGLLWVFSSVVGFLVSWYFVQNCSCSKEPAQLFPALLKSLNQWYYSNRITLSSQKKEKKRISIGQLTILKFHFMEPLFISVKNVYLISFIRVFHNKNIWRKTTRRNKTWLRPC